MASLRDLLRAATVLLVSLPAQAQPQPQPPLTVTFPSADPQTDVSPSESRALDALASPSAEKPPTRRWRWRRFSTEEYVVTGAAMAMSVGALLIKPSPGRWNGGVLVDEDARRQLRLDDYLAERRARDASDVLLAATLATPVLADAVATAGWYHRSPDVAQQMLLIDAEVLAVTTGVHGLVAGVVSRERPYGRNCGTELSPESLECRRNERYRSFFSGHSATAFAGASLMCIHHQELSLYGGGVPDAVACGAGYAAATATATLRVVGDMHYVSDVVVGAAWGTIAGLGLPWFFHYRVADADSRRSTAELHLVPYPGGISFGGTF